MPSSIAFLGAGNMACSLIGGLVNAGFPPTGIGVSDPRREAQAHAETAFGVGAFASNAQAVLAADVVVLAVKPQVMQEVAREIAPAVQSKRPLLLSVAAGIREQTLSGWLGKGLPLVRAMPNTPALVQSAATVLYANALVSEEQRDLAESILRAVGTTCWVDDESLMDVVTALSGSGPAYFFFLMEQMERAGVSLGLPAEMARLLTLETAFGAAKMALESPDAVTTLRERVTSPGGTTQRAISLFEEAEMSALVLRAMTAACDRSRELAELLADEGA